jgi:hypothetical protein
LFKNRVRLRPVLAGQIPAWTSSAG